MNATVLAARMPFSTRHFNEGQTVWLVALSREAAQVVGQFREHGAYMRAWINWKHDGRPEPDFKPAEVEAAFAGRMGLITNESR